MSKPYTYQFHGHHAVEVTFTPQGVGALPNVTYQDAFTPLASFHGNEAVTLTDTPAGTMVTVTLLTQPDFGTTQFSFLIPNVDLPESDPKRAPVHTVGLKVLHRTSIAPQALVGQLDLYLETPLVGEASDIGIHPL
jgi:hypothetical protein